MDWLKIVNDVSLVFAGAGASLMAMILIERFRYRRKRRDIAELVYEDINAQLERLELIGDILTTKPGSDEIDTGWARYYLLPFDRTVFDSIVTDISALPSESFKNIYRFYHMAQILQEKVEAAASLKTIDAFGSAFAGGYPILYKMGLMAKLALQKEVFKNRTEIEELKQQINLYEKLCEKLKP